MPGSWRASGGPTCRPPAGRWIRTPADGHDAALLGSIRYTLFRDRLDRVFACERYAVRSGNEDADLDLLYDQLSEQDVDSMPRLDAELVRRCDLNGSPGWACADLRFLLASGEFGRLDRLPWPQEEPDQAACGVTARPRTAATRFVRGMGAGGGRRPGDAGHWARADLRTYVVAHTLDPLSQQIELFLGRPQLNSGGGQAWSWRQNLLGTPPADGGRRGGDAPLPFGPDTVPDAPVRLRRPAEERRDDRAGGKQ